MSKELKTISLDGVDYVRKDSIAQPAESFEGLDYVLIRGKDSGVFVGYLKELDGHRAEVKQCRRLWYWSGAASLSQLAIDGVSNGDECKFPEEVGSQLILDAIEVINVTKKAQESIASVEYWRA